MKFSGNISSYLVRLVLPFFVFSKLMTNEKLLKIDGNSLATSRMESEKKFSNIFMIDYFSRR